jgi:hypothetical protein
MEAGSSNLEGVYVRGRRRVACIDVGDEDWWGVETPRKERGWGIRKKEMG